MLFHQQFFRLGFRGVERVMTKLLDRNDVPESTKYADPENALFGKITVTRKKYVKLNLNETSLN